MHPVEFISDKYQKATIYVHEKKEQFKEAVNKAKVYVKNDLISQEEIQKIKDTAKKVLNFINDNKSILFFGLTILLSYYMAPAGAVKFLSEKGISLKTAFLTGVFLGAALLSLKHLFVVQTNKKDNPNNKKMANDDKINFLIGISNICQTLISPIAGLVYSTATAGFILIKTAYAMFSHKSEEAQEKKVFFLFNIDTK